MEPVSADIRSVSPTDNPPLSFTQEAALFYEGMASVRTREYAQPVTALAVSVTGQFDLQIFRTALNEIIQRHRILRTSFHYEIRAGGLAVGGLNALTRDLMNGPVRPSIHCRQTVEPFPEAPPICIVRAEPDEATHKHFSYDEAPLLLATVREFDRNTHVLCILMPLLVCDARSAEILSHELSVIYESIRAGQDPPLPPPRIQYADFAHWQRRTLHGSYIFPFIEYWKRQHHDYPPFTTRELPFVKSVCADATLRASVRQECLEADATARIHRLRRDRTLSTETPYLTALTLLLFTYTQKTRIGIVTFLSGRFFRECEYAIGWFAQPLLVGSCVDAKTSLHCLLSMIQAQLDGAHSHSALPTVLIHKHLRGRTPGPPSMERRLAFSPVALEVLSPKRLASPAGLSFQRLSPHIERQTEWGLKLTITEHDDGVELAALYQTAVLEGVHVMDFLRNLALILTRLPKDIHMSVATWASELSERIQVGEQA